MKKLIKLGILMATVFTLSSCGGKTNTDNTGTNTTTDKKETAKLDENLDLSKIEGEITISAFQSGMDMPGQESFLDTAAKKFMEKYPNTKINLVKAGKPIDFKQSEGDDGAVASIGISETFDQDVIDYNKQVNVDLLSGGGADIYSTGNIMPVTSLANQGYLEDLNKYIEADTTFDKSKYYTNIFDAMQYKDGLYAMPTDFIFSYLGVDKEILPEGKLNEITSKTGLTFKEMFEEGIKIRNEQKSEDKVVINKSVEELAGMYVGNNTGKFVDVANKKVTFNSGEFEQVLDMIKKYNDEGYVGLGMNLDLANMQQDKIMEALSQKTPFYDSSYMDLIIQTLLKDSEALTPELRTGYEQMNGTKQSGPLLFDDDNKAMFVTMNSFAINSNSKNKALAWAFTKFLLEDEMQSSLSLIGLPVQKASTAEKSKSYFSMFLTGNAVDSAENKPLTESQQKLVDEYLLTLDKYVVNLNSYYFQDKTIGDIITKELKKFATEGQSSKVTVDAIQNAVELYINEQ